MKTIELSEEEIKVTIQLIDIAIKASGLNVAEAGCVLAKKFGFYLQEVPTEVEESPIFAEDPSNLEVLEEEG